MDKIKFNLHALQKSSILLKISLSGKAQQESCYKTHLRIVWMYSGNRVETLTNFWVQPSNNSMTIELLPKYLHEMNLKSDQQIVHCEHLRSNTTFLHVDFAPCVYCSLSWSHQIQLASRYVPNFWLKVSKNALKGTEWKYVLSSRIAKDGWPE